MNHATSVGFRLQRRNRSFRHHDVCFASHRSVSLRKRHDVLHRRAMRSGLSENIVRVVVVRDHRSGEPLNLATVLKQGYRLGRTAARRPASLGTHEGRQRAFGLERGGLLNAH
jgi:hypothetical protein